MTTQEFKTTTHFTDPKIRWFYGHFITAKELKQITERVRE